MSSPVELALLLLHVFQKRIVRLASVLGSDEDVVEDVSDELLEDGAREGSVDVERRHGLFGGIAGNSLEIQEEQMSEKQVKEESENSRLTTRVPSLVYVSGTRLASQYWACSYGDERKAASALTQGSGESMKGEKRRTLTIG
jgi:hypothetical protein